MNRLLLFFCFLLAISCSPQFNVYNDYDREVNISAYSTYQWQVSPQPEPDENPIYRNELNDKRIKKAVDNAMKAKGYSLSDKDPELKLHYHIVVEDKTVVQLEPFGYKYSPYWLRREMNTYQYKEGTLIIDVMDAKTNTLAWRGWAVAMLDDINPKNIERQLNNVVLRIFKKFPASIVNNPNTKVDINARHTYPRSN
jgi:hypothetical protein